MACSIMSSPLAELEVKRLERIAENRRRLEECGLLHTAKEFMKTVQTAISKPAIKKRTPKARRHKTRHQPVRRSGRLNGSTAEFAALDDDNVCITYSDDEPGLKDLLAGDAEIDSLPQEKQVEFQEMRCAATGRGSVYDSVAGITCHFCRQKKLCGEEGCPRCSRRSTTAECIGKSDCARCHSATGRFCRACLLIRYGQTLEDVREQMASGTWLCPHCYEEEHPHEGWMCNSSICMKRRGYRPTGIAIYDAQQRGFPSVAHWLQAQLLKEQDPSAAAAGKAAPAAAAAAGAKAPPAAAAAAGNASNTASGSSKAGSCCDSNNTAAVEGEASSGKAAAAAAPAAAAAGKKGAVPAAAAASKGKAGKGKAGAKGSPAAAGDDDDSGMVLNSQGSIAAAAAAEAPSTPLKTFEAPTPGPAAAAGGRATRAAAAAGVKAGKGHAVAAAAAPAAKRACVGESAGTRRSLRFRR